MAKLFPVVGAVLNGGRSVRFGSPKSIATLGGCTLIQSVHDMLATDCLSVAVVGDRSGLAGNPVVLADAEISASGPLAGVLAALRWARQAGAAWLATAPCDTPLLPNHAVARMIDEAIARQALLAVARGPDGIHPLAAVWSCDIADRLANDLSHGHPPVRAIMESFNAVSVAFPSWALLNINKVDDLAAAATAVFAGGSFRGEAPVFDFEADFAATLRCIPMLVRAKLDRGGVKLSLKQWSRLQVDQREAVAHRACDTPIEIKLWRDTLVDSLPASHNAIIELPVDENPAWADTNIVPEVLDARVHKHSGSNLPLEDWARLRPLQRFALLKLARDSHEQANLPVALREFGFNR